MTAAAPPPPPHLVPVSSMNGFALQYNYAGPGTPRGGYLHYKDLVASAQDQIRPTSSMTQLLDRASNALQAANTNRGFGRPDYAFVEFIVAQLIISDALPRQKDFPSLADHPRLKKQYDDCLWKLSKARPAIDQVTREVMDDNQRTGVLSRSQSTAQGDFPGASENAVATNGSLHQQAPRPQSVQSTSRADYERSDAIPGQRYRDSFSTVRADDEHTRYIDQHGVRPPVHAKPQNLQSHISAQNGWISNRTSQPGSADPLLDRFSALRMSDGSPDSSSHGQAKPRVSVQSNLSKDLPKVPSPTYSPAKAMPDDLNLKTSQRNRESFIAGSDTIAFTSTASLPYPESQTDPEPVIFARRPESAASSHTAFPAAKRRAENLPQETEINAQRLYDYMSQYSILLIDVRTRDEFDSGHILGHIICVEPAALRPQRSAEELQEALIVSPEKEQDLFSRRHQFDLVVYYDRLTETTDFLHSQAGTQNPLRYLHDTLYQYNTDKPLKWQPILLVGGLDAWVELVGGVQALETSNTRLQDVKSARPIARRPPASIPSRMNASRKRYRDYNPLAPEEEKKWRERARSETVTVPLASQDPRDEPDYQSDRIDAQSTGTYDNFQQRYPDVASVESNVMGSRPPTRAPPAAPQVPSYPAPPAPTVPSRPQPALPRPSYSGVSERATNLNQTVSRNSQLPPYIPPKLHRLPRTGLHNFGVTCYMNATIQCLSATLPLTMFFLEDRWKASVQKENWKGSKGLMPALYNTLLTNIWRPGEAEVIRPTNFRKFCARLNREWGIDRQQDAKEFLDFLLDTLHEDLNINWARNPLRTLTPEEEASRERTPHFLAAKSEFARYLHRDCSKLTDLFAGQHISRLQCTTCGHSSTTYETFFSISVEIPSNKGRPVSLHDCLRSYTTKEVLAGNELWHCPRCRADREATKRIIITRAPDFLVIHFKRFSASHSEKARKVHTPIEFPLRGLDLAPYMLGPPDEATVKYIEQKAGPSGFDAPAGMKPPYRYDAYAVMRHLGGTMGSGHYIALVEDKSRGRWRQFNDDMTNDFSPDLLPPRDRLQNEQAYIVFYQRTWT